MATHDRTPEAAEQHGAELAGGVNELLLDAGLITRAQARDIARHSSETDISFEQAAVELGFVTADDLESILRAPLEGRVLVEAHVSQELFSYHAPTSPAAEDVRSLRNSLTLRWLKHPEGGRILSVISPRRQEGRSLCIANLAIAFAQIGQRTLLIDADMRNPRQHELFGLTNQLGLTGYLAERSDEAAHYSVPGLEMLTIIPVGPLPPSPQELLLRPNLHALLESAALQFDVVLVDTPAAASGTDYQILARASRGALLLAQGQNSRMREAAQMVRTLRDLGVKIVGGSLVEPQER